MSASSNAAGQEKIAEFVEGWSMVQTLGEGAFGEVKLLINRDNGEAVALKMVDMQRHPEAETNVKKEMLIHKLLKHPNIIKFFGSRREGMMQYMFLEYAVGGELFDRIEPDIGMSADLARQFFKEIIAGVQYLHSRGVTHRDIKPENILLDANDTIKITDFGMATLFRHAGRERLLNRRCGTRPYMAPEVLLDEEYAAKPADLWCCGVVLVAMLAGELPWDEPSVKCKEFIQWKKREASYLSTTPWSKLSTSALSLLRKLLHPTGSQRPTATQIMDHTWVTKTITPALDTPNRPTPLLENVSPEDSRPGPSSKRMCSEVDGNLPVCHDVRLACSQPQMATARDTDIVCAATDLDTDTLCFSQPAKPDHLLLASSPSCYSSSQNTTPLQKLVRRMTRVLVKSSMQETISELKKVFETLRYQMVANTPNILTVRTVDRRGAPLVMKASILDMGGHVLVDFRLSQGCGLDFKREFLRIREAISDIIVEGPVAWGLANASNMLPA